MKATCQRCGTLVGGGPGSMTTHQKSRACRRSAFSRSGRDIARMGGARPDEPVYCEDDGDMETIPADTASGSPVPDHDYDYRVLAEHDMTEENLFKRASDRLAAVGVNFQAGANAWQEVTMVDEYDSPITALGEKRDSGDESDVSDDSNQPETSSEVSQVVVRALLDVMAPAEGGPGLAAGQRKKVFQFADTCLAYGGSDRTIADILRSVNPARGSRKPSSSSEYLLDTYLESLCSGDGWVERTFSVVTGHSVTTRWNSHIIRDIVELVEDPKLFPSMRLRPEYDGKHYSHPVTGLHMHAFYSLIKKQRKVVGDWDEDRDVVLLLVFFSDATLLANKGSLSAHPVVLSVGNLPPLLSSRSQLMLGLLAEFEKAQMKDHKSTGRGLSEAEHAQLRRALMAMQTAAMVEPLVRASYEGVPFVSPIDGKKMRFFPTLFCAPLDHPEICAHLGVKQGYCGICKWKGEGMWDDVLSKAPFRTEPDSVNFVAKVSKAPARNINRLLKVQGAHGQRSGLWGFNGSAPIDRVPINLDPKTFTAVQEVGSSSPWTDVHLAVAGETMHEIDLGLLKYAQQAVLFHLKHTKEKTDQEIERINEGLRLSMTHESRWQGLKYPPTKKVTAVLQGYFGGSSKVEAGEHRAVLQFVVPVLVRFLGMHDIATRLMARMVKYYRARQVRDEAVSPGYRTHTTESLKEVDKLFDEVKAALEEVGEPPKSTVDTPKLHQQLHYRLQVMRLGTTTITTGQAGEANNARIKAPVKAGRTNKQKGSTMRTIIKLYRRSRAVAALSKETKQSRKISRIQAPVKKYRTTELVAMQRDLCIYPNQRYARKETRFTTVDIHNWTRNHIGSTNRPREMAKRDVTTDLRRDLFSIVPVESMKDQDTPVNRQLAFLLGDWTVGKAFANEVSFFLTGEDSDTTARRGLNLVIKIVSSAANPSVFTKSSRDETDVRILQRVRATPNHRKTKKAWFGFVAVSADVPEKGDHVWYARLILLFHIRDPNKRGKWQQLAFIRYLARQESLQDEESRRGRPGEPQVTTFLYAKRQRHTKMVWYYGVCSSESILRRVHIVAGNDEASLSLRFSRGDHQYFENDRKSVFLLNYNVFERNARPYTRPRPPAGREWCDSESGESESE